MSAAWDVPGTIGAMGYPSTVAGWVQLPPSDYNPPLKF